MLRQKTEKHSPFASIAAGCFIATRKNLQFAAIVLSITAGAMSQVYAQEMQPSPAGQKSLSEKLMQDMGRDLNKLTAPSNTSRPQLRPENRVPQRNQAPTHNQAKAGNSADFDFYVLSLSWSPSFCADNANRPNARQQCGSGRGYGFIAHGLWPQYESGFPQDCDHPQAGLPVPRDIVSALSPFMPSAGLMRHQWRKHGTCSGLNQRDYFNSLSRAYQAVTIPPTLRNVNAQRQIDPQLIKNAFATANPGLSAKAIAVTCKDRKLQEVRICMDKNLQFRECKQVSNNSCRSRSILMPSNR